MAALQLQAAVGHGVHRRGTGTAERETVVCATQVASAKRRSDSTLRPERRSCAIDIAQKADGMLYCAQDVAVRTLFTSLCLWYDYEPQLGCPRASK